MNQRRRVVLIDGHHLAYRNYFALGDLATSRGEPVQAVYGFARTLFKLLREDGDCVVVVFDTAAPTFRQEQYADYKAHRIPSPDDFRHQLEQIRHLVDLLGLYRLELPGYEADDVIGSLALQAERENYEVRVVTGDRDAFQLLTQGVKVILPDGSEMTPGAVQERYGISVEQWVDFRALTGDPSDNIPGARGIGPKTAAKLLATWPTLAEIMAHREETKGKVKESLYASEANIWLSQELSRIQTDLPVGIDFAACRNSPPRTAELKAFLEELEFGSLLRELDLLEPELINEAAWPPPAGAFWGWSADRVQPMWAHLTGLAAAWSEGVATGPAEPRALAGFGPISTMSTKDLCVLAGKEGIDLEPGDDPLLLAYLIDPNNNDPAAAVARYGGGNYGNTAPERALASKKLFEIISPRVEAEPKLSWLYHQLEQPLQGVLAQLELRGVRIDREYLQDLSIELAGQIETLEKTITDYAGHPFNLNSAQQLEQVLFDELQLTPGKKTQKTGRRSTSAATLEALREEHPVVAALLEYRELQKLKGTYLDPLPALIHPQTGRVHTRFHQTGTQTGRLSSSDPNLQNIPVRTELGRRVRRAFLAEPGFVLVAADYSQIELRILAHMSHDQNLIEVFQEGRDIHSETAARLFGPQAAGVKGAARRAAKTINFGILYGMSAHRLSNELGIAYADAQKFIEAYFASYPGVKLFSESVLNQARERGFVETLFGRRRYVPDLNSRNRAAREAAERMAFNMPLQGTAADLIKLAMCEAQSELAKLDGFLILQVHDELVAEVPAEQAPAAARVLARVMENIYPLEVPLAVEAGFGANWFDAKAE